MNIGLGLGVTVRNGAGIAVPPLTLMGVSAAAAYGLRRLRAAYSGQAIRVRRSGDNVEADIGFTPTGELDLIALLAHCGANSGFIVTWYDQSGNARNATQTLTTIQPRIVNAGVVETKGLRPAIRAHINTSSLSSWKFAAPSTAWSFNAVASADDLSVNQNNVIGMDGQAGLNGFYPAIINTGSQAVFTRVAAVDSVFSGTVSVANGQNVVCTTTHTAANAGQQFTNGSGGSVFSGLNWLTAVPAEFRIGEYTGNSAFYLLGTYQEVISFTSALTTTERQILERNQGSYYAISVA